MPGEPGKICRSPFPSEHKNGDANPSFSIYDDGRRAKDFATGEHFDVFDFICKSRGCDVAEAIRFVQDRLGIPRPECKPDAAKKPGAKIPPLRRGTESELHELAERRGFNPEALRLAERRGFLWFTAFPSYRGFEFANKYFRADLKAAIREFAPDLVIFDPWNEIARDSMEKDYQEAFELLREVMAEGPNAACLIVHHLRKPRADDRHRGRNLANLLAGSYVLQSKPRCVLVMQPASDDTEDARVVVTPVKNNDGEYGPRTAWERKAGWFEPLPESEFDWEAFDSGNVKREPKVKEEHLRKLFDNGRNKMKKPRAAERLEEIADVKRSAAYEALKLDGGRFSHLLLEDPDTGLIGLKPAEPELPTKAD